MYRPNPLETPARLAAHLGSCHPGAVPRSALADAVAVAEGMPDQDRVDVMLALVDWHVSAGPARLAMMLETDPSAVRTSILRGRLALARAGLRPDGSPMAAGSPCRRG